MVSEPFLFGFIRGPVSQRRVEPFLIVTQFDPSSNIFDGPVACWIAGPVDTFLLESRIERLRPRIVITDAGAAHGADDPDSVSYTHLRAHETDSYLVCRLLLEKKKKN